MMRIDTGAFGAAHRKGGAAVRGGAFAAPTRQTASATSTRLALEDVVHAHDVRAACDRERDRRRCAEGALPTGRPVIFPINDLRETPTSSG